MRKNRYIALIIIIFACLVQVSCSTFSNQASIPTAEEADQPHTMDEIKFKNIALEDIEDVNNSLTIVPIPEQYLGKGQEQFVFPLYGVINNTDRPISVPYESAKSAYVYETQLNEWKKLSITTINAEGKLSFDILPFEDDWSTVYVLDLNSIADKVSETSRVRIMVVGNISEGNQVKPVATWVELLVEK